MKTLFFVFCLSGCAVVTSTSVPTAHPSFPISIGIDSEELAMGVLAGALVWADLRVTLTIDDNAHKRVRCATWGMGSAAATTNASGISVDCLYFYGLDDAEKTHLFAHELGHVLGLLHVDDTISVMSPEMSDILTLTSSDLAEFTLRIQ
jgi:hypothetical protein